MKKIIGFFALLFILNSCDDGDVVAEDIDFIDTETLKCEDNDVIYQLKNNNALILELSDDSFTDAFQEIEETRYVSLTNLTDKLIYRSFDGTVATDNICAAIRPSSPNVTSEWTAQSATLKIVTKSFKTTNETTGQSVITSYRHTLTFLNIVWKKQDGTQIVESERSFGFYKVNANTLTLNFIETTALVKNTCNNNSVYSVNGSESMQLKLEAANYSTLFPATSIVGTKRLTLNTDNKLTFTLFSSAVTTNYFCATTIPSTPTPIESWVSIPGTGFTTGYIEVKTETSGVNFLHTVTAKNTTLLRGTNKLILKFDQPLGSFLTSN